MHQCKYRDAAGREVLQMQSPQHSRPRTFSAVFPLLVTISRIGFCAYKCQRKNKQMLNGARETDDAKWILGCHKTFTRISRLSTKYWYLGRTRPTSKKYQGENHKVAKLNVFQCDRIKISSTLNSTLFQWKNVLSRTRTHMWRIFWA